MATEQEAGLKTTQIHEIYIRASAEAIWEAITSPEWSVKYGYQGIYEYDLRPGGRYRALPSEEMKKYGVPDVMIDGEVIEAVPPRRLVQTYRFLFSKENEAEGFTRLTFDIEPTPAGFCRLTITHELDNAPLMAHATASKFTPDGGGGWGWILSDLKSLLETGKPMTNW
jgi:uncharacterized protein YndB with AHSA1/START domain